MKLYLVIPSLRNEDENDKCFIFRSNAEKYLETLNEEFNNSAELELDVNPPSLHELDTED